jgi:pilus assembly protein CpaB
LIAFFLALLIAGTVTAIVYRRLRDVVAGQRKVIRIVAAAHDLRSGMTLTTNDVATIDWPPDVSLPGSFSKVEDVVGHPLIYSIGAKEPILQRELAVEGSGIGLSAKIPDGMRATAVRSNEIVGVGGFLYPGSHVDVLATYNLPGSSGNMTQTVLQDVQVLTAGQTIEPDPQGKPQSVSVVTLLLSPEDSQKLLLASSQGSIQFVLRSGVDKEKVDITPTRLDELFPNVKRAAPVTPPKKNVKQPPPPAPEAYTLEVIQGTQRNTQKF